MSHRTKMSSPEVATENSCGCTEKAEVVDGRMSDASSPQEITFAGMKPAARSGQPAICTSYGTVWAHEIKFLTADDLLKHASRLYDCRGSITLAACWMGVDRDRHGNQSVNYKMWEAIADENEHLYCCIKARHECTQESGFSTLEDVPDSQWDSFCDAVYDKAWRIYTSRRRFRRRKLRKQQQAQRAKENERMMKILMSIKERMKI